MDPSAGIGMHWARILTASIVPIVVAMYGVMAFIQAGVLFWLGLAVEERARRRELDPSWRALRN
jgi:hypothetical protein